MQEATSLSSHIIPPAKLPHSLISISLHLRQKQRHGRSSYLPITMAVIAWSDNKQGRIKTRPSCADALNKTQNPVAISKRHLNMNKASGNLTLDLSSPICFKPKCDCFCVQTLDVLDVPKSETLCTRGNGFQGQPPRNWFHFGERVLGSCHIFVTIWLLVSEQMQRC